MKKAFIFLIIAIIPILVLLVSCEDYTENFPVPPASVVSKFSYESTTDFSVPDTLYFTNESIIPERASSANYLWDFGDGTTSTEENPMHVFTTTGEREISLTVETPVDTVIYAVNARFIKLPLFRETFEGISTIPENWVLVNVDGNTPDNPSYAVMEDSAWIVYNSTSFNGNVALGLSFYSPEAAADDWMILPKVTVGDSTYLSWRAMSFTTSGNYPDSYQVYVSTTTQDVNGCLANGIVYRVNDESWGADITDNPGEGIKDRSLYLSQRFAGQDVYVAFRLMTPFPGGDRLAIDDITIYDEE